MAEHWTDEELRCLRDHYATLPRKELQAFIPARNWNAIQQRGLEMGIRRTAERPKWTPEQIEEIKVAYPTGEQISVLAKRLKHSPSAIKTLASRLGVERERRQQPRTASRRAWWHEGALLGHLTDLERGYIAGLFDGEGSIGIMRQAGNCNQLVLHITNTDPRVIYWLHDKIPVGTINFGKAKARRKAWFKFRLSTVPAVKFCQELAPNLIIKRDEAALVAEALKAGFSPLSIEQRRDLRLVLHTLKSKGSIPITS